MIWLIQSQGGSRGDVLYAVYVFCSEMLYIVFVSGVRFGWREHFFHLVLVFNVFAFGFRIQQIPDVIWLIQRSSRGDVLYAVYVFCVL